MLNTSFEVEAGRVAHLASVPVPSAIAVLLDEFYGLDNYRPCIVSP
jgi:hypothetical protein